MARCRLRGWLWSGSVDEAVMDGLLAHEGMQ